MNVAKVSEMPLLQLYVSPDCTVSTAAITLSPIHPARTGDVTNTEGVVSNKT